MIHRCSIALAGLLMIAALRPARAVDWERVQIAATAERGAAVVRTQFGFKNRSPKLVHLLGVSPSCGCTETTLSSSHVAPGESGVLYVWFTVGKRHGVQVEKISVLTDESNIPTVLTLQVTIPPKADTVSAPKP